MNENKALVPEEVLPTKIYFIRGQKVMLDRDLALLYGVSTGNLNKSVKRNIHRFPGDFMFHLNKEEFDNLIFQIGISSWGGTRKMPCAFTEQGIAMLSGVLNSVTAIRVHIQIIRAFTRLREMVLTNKDVLLKVERLEKEFAKQGKSIELVFNYLKQFVKDQENPRKKIGFKRDDKP